MIKVFYDMCGPKVWTAHMKIDLPTEKVRELICLNREITKTFFSVPGGRTTLTHRLGDFFTEIRFEEGILFFFVKPGVLSFWKDSVFHIMESVRG